MGIFKGVCFFVSLITGASAFAQSTCVFRNQLMSAGYLISQKQVNILRAEHRLPRNAKKLISDKVMGVEKSILNVWKKSEIKGISAASLALLIVGVAESVGVDYQILAAIIKKESNFCMFRLNKTGGDSGCMQFTTPALKEMKHQFGFAGSDKHSKGVPEALGELVQKFFAQASPARANAYIQWFNSDTEKIKNSLRNESNFDFDILSGALFLKFTLANASGDYGTAVRNYNGSSKKFAYQSSVLASASKVSFSIPDEAEASCLADETYENEIQQLSCEFTEDPEACYRMYFQNLPNAT